MSQPYQALYRSWRPQRFDQVVGQEHVVRTLQNALRGGRIAHAYLFAGPRGTGKTSVAKLLAKAVNCESPDGTEPCNRCGTCREINDGSTMDVLEIDAASNRGIDEIRELRERVRYAPARARYKVYIIDEVHMLTTEAFNALLKTLEEPPAHTLFILATTEPHRIPATIVSRCQRFDFHRLGQDEIVGRLAAVCEALGVEADERSLRLLARHADGGLRDALSMLDQCLTLAEERLDYDLVADLLGLASDETMLALVRAAARGDLAAGLQTIAALAAQGRDLAQVLRDWLACWRDLLAVRLGLGAGELLYASPETLDELRALARELDEAAALAGFDLLAEAESLLRWSGQPRLALESALIRAIQRLGGPGGTTGGVPRPAAEEESAAAGEPAPRPARPRAAPAAGTGTAAAGNAGPGATPVVAAPEGDRQEGPEGGHAAASAGASGDPSGSPDTGGGPDGGEQGGPAPAGHPADRLVAEWDRFLASLGRRRELTALNALLRWAGRPYRTGDGVEVPFGQPGMARTAEAKQAQLQRAVADFLGETVPVRVVAAASPAHPRPGPPGPGGEPAGGRRRRRAGVEPEQEPDPAPGETRGAAPIPPAGAPETPGAVDGGQPAASRPAAARPTAARRGRAAAVSSRSSSPEPPGGQATRPDGVRPNAAGPHETDRPGGTVRPAGSPGADSSGGPGATGGAGAGGESLDDNDRVLALAQELFGGEWVDVKEEWRREFRPNGEDAQAD